MSRTITGMGNLRHLVGRTLVCSYVVYLSTPLKVAANSRIGVCDKLISFRAVVAAISAEPSAPPHDSRGPPASRHSEVQSPTGLAVGRLAVPQIG
ncbi:hypothetical protein EVAR_88733_1 [Eumeta japonica]|uniref:Uncharacterized protein n=1 Tax=Eumeta variegata TaxID=151549 RepID=A0A4C1XHN5_EUMVA|nr:hypothetical protein EVAR_88733_1 [Eumeta japonica]